MNPSPDQLYRECGFVLVAGLVDAATVAACRDHLERIEGAADGHMWAVGPGGDAFLDGVAGDARLAGLARALLGRAPVPFGYTYFQKPAGTGLAARWHQDGHPWRTQLGVTSAVTLWIALDPTGADNGALVFLPGSHTRPAQPLVAHDGPSMFGVEMATGPADGSQAVTVGMDPGDVCAHHPDVVHSSGPNRSTGTRRALALRYRSP